MNQMSFAYQKLCNQLRTSQMGSTLLEVLIAIAILGIITAVFIHGLVDAVHIRSESDVIKVASALATSEVEKIKKLDVKPTEMSSSKVVDGLTVNTSYTDVTDSLNLTKDEVPQSTTSKYVSPIFELNIGSDISGSASGVSISSVPLSSLTTNKIQIVGTTVSGSTNLVDYELVYVTSTGQQSIALGRYTKATTDNVYAKVNVKKELLTSLNLEIIDNASNALCVGIFDDTLNRVSCSITGINTKSMFETGIISNSAGNQLGLKYYNVVVTVTKGSEEYARVLTTWTVEDK